MPACRLHAQENKHAQALHTAFIESRYNKLPKSIVNFLGIQSEVLNNFKEKLRIFAEYKHWESSDLFIECAYILFGTEWNIVTIRSD